MISKIHTRETLKTMSYPPCLLELETYFHLNFPTVFKVFIAFIYVFVLPKSKRNTEILFFPLVMKLLMLFTVANLWKFTELFFFLFTLLGVSWIYVCSSCCCCYFWYYMNLATPESILRSCCKNFLSIKIIEQCKVIIMIYFHFSKKN